MTFDDAAFLRIHRQVSDLLWQEWRDHPALLRLRAEFMILPDYGRGLLEVCLRAAADEDRFLSLVHKLDVQLLSSLTPAERRGRLKSEIGQVTYDFRKGIGC